MRILLKTTIPQIDDDWHIGRFAMLTEHLVAQGHEVTARDRVETGEGDDADLAALADYDQLWLFAVDETGALTQADAAAIAAFNAQGGGLLITRDHMNLGACLTKIGPVGLTQHFQAINPEADATRHCIDDTISGHISWPNYHSGANGDFQPIERAVGDHPLIAGVTKLPAHPHEGAVGVPNALEGRAKVVATGRSKLSGARFNLVVAVEGEGGSGRVVSDSSFHHLCDYNWDPRAGCPSFVSEPPGNTMLTDPEALPQAKRYASNIATWLGGATTG